MPIPHGHLIRLARWAAVSLFSELLRFSAHSRRHIGLGPAQVRFIEYDYVVQALRRIEPMSLSTYAFVATAIELHEDRPIRAVSSGL